MVDKLLNLAKITTEIVNYGLKEISALERDEIESKELLDECKRRLQNLNNKSKTFVDKVKTLLCFGDLSKSKVRKFKKEYKNRKHECINDYISQIKRHLKQCRDCYQRFKAACDEVKTLFKDVSGNIVAKETRAQWNRAAVMVVGGVLTLGADAAGWILTGGSKLPILSAEVAERIAALGTATKDRAREETQRYIDHFEKAQETFQNIWKKLHELGVKMSEMNADIENMPEILKHIEMNTENVDESVNSTNPVHYEQFCSVFDTLLGGISRARHELCPPAAEEYSPTVIGFILVVLIAVLVYHFYGH